MESEEDLDNNIVLLTFAQTQDCGSEIYCKKIWNLQQEKKVARTLL